MKKKIFIYSLLIMILSLSSFNTLISLNKSDVEKHLDKTFKSVKSIKLDYSDMNNKYNRGYLKAKLGNKYRINTSDRIIVCNGEKIWNFAINENKIIQSKFDKDRKGLSIEDLFFDILKKAKISSFKKQTSTNKNYNNLYSTDFEINSSEKDKYKINNLNILFDEKINIKYIRFNYNGQDQNIKINSIVLNKNINDKEFRLKIPKNCQVIELE